LWDVSSGRELQQLKGHRGPVETLAFSPDGRLLVTGASDGSIRVWQPPISKPRHVLPGNGPWVAFRFSQDGGTLLAEGRDNAVHFWEVNSGKLLRKAPLKQEMTVHVFSPTAQSIILEDRDHSLSLWDFAASQEICKLRGLTSWITTATFSPDGRLVAAGVWKSTVARLWEA